MKTIGIIGYGNVGETLAKYINNCDKLKLSWICSKHFNNKTIFPDTKLFTEIAQIQILPDVIFITSKDKDICDIANMLADTFTNNLHSKIVIHTSGALGLESLTICEKYGAIVCAAHPFQTFFSKEIDCLNNIFWGIEISNNEYLADISDLIISFNGHPFFLPPEIINNKALYHCIAVSVSNYVAGAIKLGTLIANEINLPKKDFFVPIINQTIENCLNSIINNDNDFPVTGPIVRNDTKTIEKHIKALNNFPVLQQSYIDFANGLKSIFNTKKN
ncbi:MAG: DUF2520 domain-containing protein [Bacteroidetes bacterium]|nr:DUF2520 domain-containing protein [Bacteroidota bacterium]